MSNNIEIIVMVPIFIVLFVVIYNVLRENAFFQNGNILTSLCVSILCVLGIHRMIAQGKYNSGDNGFNIILLSYATLGISILFLMLISKWAKIDRDNWRKERKGRENKSLSNKIRKL